MLNHLSFNKGYCCHSRIIFTNSVLAHSELFDKCLAFIWPQCYDKSWLYVYMKMRDLDGYMLQLRMIGMQ